VEETGLKGIKNRLMLSYMAVICITVFSFETFIILFVNYFYANNIKEILLKQATAASNFYHEYIVTQSTDINYQELADSFSQSSNAEVQITNQKGKLLADSMRNSEKSEIDTPDVRSACKGKSKIWNGKTGSLSEPVLSLSYPLRTGEKVTGVVRYITSLSEVNRVVANITKILIAAGIAIIAVVAMIGLFLSGTIVNPIKEMIGQTEKIAAGNYNLRLTKKYNDELGVLSDTMNDMLEEINKNENLKKEFISSISHELRTPLTAINGWAITLQRPDMKDREVIAHGLGIIEKESSRLTSLVEDLLDFSRLSAGKITLHMKLLDVNDIVAYVRDHMLPRAQRQNVEIVVHLEQELENITADSDRLKQVLINILDNSLKFTPEDGRIDITTANTDNGVIITIKDTGIGIDPLLMPDVKKKFVKGKQKGSGSGIGLAICEEIVSLHGGAFTIESEPQKGTRVRIFLPFHVSVTKC
jgi:signal transduction histidine kinase